MKLLYRISAIVNILFGVVLVFAGILFIYLFISTFSGFAQGAPNFLNIIGIGFFTGGFLVVAIPLLIFGTLYLIFGYRTLHNPQPYSLILTCIAFGIVFLYLLRDQVISGKTAKYEEKESRLAAQASLSDINVVAQNKTFVVSYSMNPGTEGRYVLQTELVTEDSPDEQLYYTTDIVELTSHDNIYTKQITFSDAFSTCRTGSQNWICVALNNTNVDADNLVITVKADLQYIGDEGILDTINRSDAVYFPDKEFSFEINSDATYDNIRIVQ